LNQPIALTPEQFKELLAEVKASAAPKAAAGLAAPLALGLGCPPDNLYGPLATGVYSMLAAGSPRLALAKALGCKLAPYFINVRATFDNTDVTDIPSVGSDVKIVQDTLVDCLIVRTVNQSIVANSSTFQAESDWFFNFQSGLEATLDVQGAPRYAVAPRFTPLSTIADMVSGQSHWPGGWILTYQQQLFMAFHATVTLPYAPVEVICTYRSWVPEGEMFVDMTNREALDRLAVLGIVVPDAYRNRILGVL
jgi:hypothetical protein